MSPRLLSGRPWGRRDEDGCALPDPSQEPGLYSEAERAAPMPRVLATRRDLLLYHLLTTQCSSVVPRYGCRYGCRRCAPGAVPHVSAAALGSHPGPTSSHAPSCQTPFLSAPTPLVGAWVLLPQLSVCACVCVCVCARTLHSCGWKSGW